MVGIHVSYRHGFMDIEPANVITRVVRLYGALFFSRDKANPLEADDFSFKFLDPSKYDRLSHEIIVRIAPSYVSAEFTLDDHASRIAQDIIKGMDPLQSQRMMVGVELMVDGHKGWGEALLTSRLKMATVAASPRRHTPGA